MNIKVAGCFGQEPQRGVLSYDCFILFDFMKDFCLISCMLVKSKFLTIRCSELSLFLDTLHPSLRSGFRVCSRLISLTVLLSMVLLTPRLSAVTTLATGDISIIGMSQDQPDQFSFVTFVDLDAGTIIYFTDMGWRNNDTWRCASEGVGEWIVPAGGVAAGTIVTGIDTDGSEGVDSFSVGTYCNIFGGGSTLKLTAAGDSITVFQAPNCYLDENDIQMIAMLNTNASWDADSCNRSTTTMPLGLTCGVTAFLHGEIDNLRVNDATLTKASQSPAAWLTDFGNYPCNWDNNCNPSFTCGTCLSNGQMTQDCIAVTQDVERFWDTNGGAAGLNGASGTWGTDTNWGNDACGGWGTGDWQDDRIATFGGTGVYTVTVCGTQEAGGLKFDDGTVILTGGTINMSDATPIIEVAAAKFATINSVLSGANGIEKTGAGTITIAGSNTYSGSTKISNGTLMLGADNTIPNASEVILNGGTFDTNGYDDTAGNLTLDATSTINLAGGNSIINFSTMNNNAGTLNIWNWDGIAGTTGGNDQIIFNTNFGAGPFANIDFYNDDGNTFIGKGTLVSIGGGFWELLPAGAVPETSTWISAGGLLAFAAWHFRRRKRIPMLSPPS